MGNKGEGRKRLSFSDLELMGPRRLDALLAEAIFNYPRDEQQRLVHPEREVPVTMRVGDPMERQILNQWTHEDGVYYSEGIPEWSESLAGAEELMCADLGFLELKLCATSWHARFSDGRQAVWGHGCKEAARAVCYALLRAARVYADDRMSGGREYTGGLQ